jgi:hypothetical protein
VLVAKADHVAFEKVGDRRGQPSIRLPARAWMWHDEDGEQWPPCSLLIGGRPKPSREVPELSAKAKRYYGGYRPVSYELALPPRDLSRWTRIGEVQRIFYVRRGHIMGGELFQHAFKGGARRFFFWGPKLARPVLLRCGDFWRLELPGGCIVNHRGFVVP